MKQIKQTNGRNETTTAMFYKGNDMVAQIIMTRRFVDDKFDIGSLTINYHGNSIPIGECVYHEEDGLMKTYGSFLTMFENIIDFDEYFTQINTTYTFKKVGDE